MPAKDLQELGQWKVGNKVIVSHRGSSLQPDYTAPISRITDGRNGTVYIKVKRSLEEIERAYDKNGFERGGDVCSSSIIEPATPEKIEKLVAERTKIRLRYFDWNKLTDTQALQLDTYLASIGINIRTKD